MATKMVLLANWIAQDKQTTMKMISFDDFWRLRLTDFLIGEMKATQVHNWEYLDHHWVGETIGFTEWLRLESDPDNLRFLSLDLAELPTKVANSVFAKIGIPSLKGMSEKYLTDVLGKPAGHLSLNGNKKTHYFLIGEGNQYEVGCTIDKKDGLVYFTILTHDMPDQLSLIRMIKMRPNKS